ncbi:MAG TPA: hypothetical protein VMT15_16000 [Bryobacteraceae bacterium]|nr:hypothetical protein [Bryobacteraceae bacterium]
MDPSTQAAPGYYVWEVPEKSVVVHLNLDVVDRLLPEIMRGFGAVRKRGAEVGGILLGTIEKGSRTIVRVEDFEPVTCEYERGPSYLFVDTDRDAFEEACQNWQPDTSQQVYAVGYFRGHTRDGFSLGPEDVGLMDRYFPSPAHVALLVKPYGTKVSVASFFAREGGVFPPTAPLEFPFRRRELTGEEAPPRRAMIERTTLRRAPAEVRSIAPEGDSDVPEPSYVNPSPAKSISRPAWVWLPLSFVFLLLGVALGFETGLTMGPKPSPGAPDFSLGLAVTKDGDNLSVKWNRDSPAVKSAEKGVLEIQDGEYSKPVDLDTAQLRYASIIFTNSTKTVRFRLIVYPQTGVTVMQEVVWRSQ